MFVSTSQIGAGVGGFDAAHFRLIFKRPSRVRMLAWARWFERGRGRVVAQTCVVTGVNVSTEFVGVGGVFFETMVFAGNDYGRAHYQTRAYTWGEAIRNHHRAVKAARGLIAWARGARPDHPKKYFAVFARRVP